MMTKRDAQEQWDAIVTAPLNKAALNLAGYHYAGHTDMLAALTGTKSSVMLLAHGNMRVSHVTTHIALEDVPKRATPAQLALTWLLAQNPWIVPIPGTTKLNRLKENVRAAAIELNAEDLRKIGDALSHFQVQGDRYPAHLAARVGK